MSDKRYQFELLGKRHNRESFHCGVESLDRYFHHQAGQDVRRRVAVSYVLADTATPGAVVGYFTLSSYSVLPASLLNQLTRKLPSYDAYPAILIGRLAVDRRYHGQKLGERLLIHALRQALQLSRVAGAIAVVVDAENNNARTFYEHFGFLTVVDDERRLFLPMTTIEKLELPP